MMLDHLGEAGAHDQIVAAISRSLSAAGARTPDLGGTATTESVTEELVHAIEDPQRQIRRG
jgi:tartrate dehydrogenase/decarboxylase / D-malate dehydrogenase